MDISKFGLLHHASKTVFPGEMYGRLTILAIGKPADSYRYKAVCRCECGAEDVVIRLDGITSGKVVSCGCYHKQVSSTHGLTKNPLYRVWRHMMQRCYNSKDRHFSNYGGRGISVCERWHLVEHFVADMQHKYGPGLEIDRTNNDGNYEPDNCEFVTRKVNTDNRRTGIHLSFNGRTQSLKRWSEETGINYWTLRERIIVWGWSTERALTTAAISTEERMQIARRARWDSK